VADRRQTVRLDLGGRPNVIGILALAGQPTAQCPVLLADPANPQSGMFQCRATTQADGSFAFSGVPSGRHAVYYQGSVEWTRWIKVTTVDVTTEDLDLGTLPRSLAQVAVTLTGPAASGATDWTVSLKEGPPFWSQKIGEVAIPETADQPFLITQVLPGTYTLLVQSPDGTRQVTKTIEIGIEPIHLDVTVEIPPGRAPSAGHPQRDRRDAIPLQQGPVAVGQTRRRQPLLPDHGPAGRRLLCGQSLSPG